MMVGNLSEDSFMSRGWQMSAQIPNFETVGHDTEVCWYLKYGIFLKKKSTFIQHYLLLMA